MTDFTPKETTRREVYFCEEHEVSIGEPKCDECKSIGWFDTVE